jgi:hypothetical protein
MGGFQACMPRDRSLQHKAIATTHEVSEAGMAQRMRGQLYLRFAPQLAEHPINRTRGQSSPFQVQKEGRLRALGEALGALFFLVLATAFPCYQKYTTG